MPRKRKSNLSRKTSNARAITIARSRETSLVAALRRFEQAKRQRARIAAETPEQTASRRRRQANYVSSKRASEKAKQSRARLKEIVTRLQKQTQRQASSRAAKKRVQSQHEEPHKLSRTTLRGVVALLSVCSESRSLALKTVLEKLGAVVLSTESPLLTHLIWSQAGCCNAGNQGGTPDCRVVSPLWVEACAASETRLTKQLLRAAAGEPEVPSAATLHNILKQFEHDNWQLSQLPEELDSAEERTPALRLLNGCSEDPMNSPSGSDLVEIEIGII